MRTIFAIALLLFGAAAAADDGMPVYVDATAAVLGGQLKAQLRNSRDVELVTAEDRAVVKVRLVAGEPADGADKGIAVTYHAVVLSRNFTGPGWIFFDSLMGSCRLVETECLRSVTITAEMCAIAARSEVGRLRDRSALSR
jgi:hypothetical protein